MVDQQSPATTQVVFHVAERGLETSISGWMTGAEFYSTPADQFEPNLNWSRVTVASEEARDEWI